MADDDQQKPSEAPEYKTYKARRGMLSGLRKPDVSSLRGLREKSAKRGGDDLGKGSLPAPPRRHPNRRKIGKWVAIAVVGWLVLSFAAFAVSAQIQAFKLSREAKEALHGNPFMLASAQTILVLGTDARPPDTQEHNESGESA